jgi:hypothetical protein
MRCASDWIYLDFQPGKTALLQSRIDGLMPGTGARNISWSAEAETSVFFHGFRVMDLALIVLGHAVVTWPAMPAQPVLTSLVWPGWLDRRLHDRKVVPAALERLVSGSACSALPSANSALNRGECGATGV